MNAPSNRGTITPSTQAGARIPNSTALVCDMIEYSCASDQLNLLITVYFVINLLEDNPLKNCADYSHMDYIPSWTATHK